MSAGLPRRMRLLLAAGLLLLAGCSAIQFSYNNAEGLIRLAAWDYLDLEHEQVDAFKLRIARYMDWHRREEMPVYARLAGEAHDRFSRAVSAENVAWAVAELRSHYRLAAARAAQETAPVLATLSESQIAVMEKKLARSNTKYEKEFVSGDENKRVKARLKRMLSTIEDFTGDLSPAQVARIERFIRAHPRSGEVRLTERRRWQKEMVAQIRATREPAALAARLVPVFSDPDRGRPEDYMRETRRWEADLAQMLVELAATLNPEQRQRALDRLAGYANDFRELAGNAPRPQAKIRE